MAVPGTGSQEQRTIARPGRQGRCLSPVLPWSPRLQAEGQRCGCRSHVRLFKASDPKCLGVCHQRKVQTSGMILGILKVRAQSVVFFLSETQGGHLQPVIRKGILKEMLQKANKWAVVEFWRQYSYITVRLVNMMEVCSWLVVSSGRTCCWAVSGGPGTEGINTTGRGPWAWYSSQGRQGHPLTKVLPARAHAALLPDP